MIFFAYAVLIVVGLFYSAQDNVQLAGFLLIASSLMLAAATMRLSRAESRHLNRNAIWAILGFVFTIAWSIVQLLPIQGLANPLWASASAIVGRPLPASISIEPNATYQSIAWTLYLTAVFILSCAVSLERRSARYNSILILILAALAMLIGTFWHSTIEKSGQCIAQAFTSILMFGASLQFFERFEVKKRKHARAIGLLSVAISICIVALMLYAYSVIILPPGLVVEMTVALVLFFFLVIVRRIDLRLRATLVVLLFLVVAAVLIIRTKIDWSASPAAIIASLAPPQWVEVLVRMIHEAPWLGTGAGSFSAVAKIYGGSPLVNFHAPSAFVGWIIERGWPALLMVGLAATLVITQTFLGSLRRGRDSFFPITTCAILLFFILSAFTERADYGLGVLTLLAAQMGLGLVQCEGRSRVGSIN